MGLGEFGIHCDSFTRPAALRTGGQLITLLCHFRRDEGGGDGGGSKREKKISLKFAVMKNQ